MSLPISLLILYNLIGSSHPYDSCLHYRSLCLRNATCHEHLTHFQTACDYNLNTCTGTSPSDCVYLLRQIRTNFPTHTCTCYQAIGFSQECDYFRQLIWNHPCERRMHDIGKEMQLNNRHVLRIESARNHNSDLRRTTRTPVADQVQAWKSELSGELTRVTLQHKTCDAALYEVCLKHISCSHLWGLFRTNCDVDQNNQCRMQDRDICWQSFEGLTWTGLGDCNCLSSNSSDCHWIRLHTNYNKCIYEISKSGQFPALLTLSAAQTDHYRQRYEQGRVEQYSSTPVGYPQSEHLQKTTTTPSTRVLSSTPSWWEQKSVPSHYQQAPPTMGRDDVSNNRRSEATPAINYQQAPPTMRREDVTNNRRSEATPAINYQQAPPTMGRQNVPDNRRSEATPTINYRQAPPTMGREDVTNNRRSEATPTVNYQQAPPTMRRDDVSNNRKSEATPAINYQQAPPTMGRQNVPDNRRSEATPTINYRQAPPTMGREDVTNNRRSEATPTVNYQQAPPTMRRDDVSNNRKSEATPTMNYQQAPPTMGRQNVPDNRRSEATPTINYRQAPPTMGRQDVPDNRRYEATPTGNYQQAPPTMGRDDVSNNRRSEATPILNNDLDPIMRREHAPPTLSNQKMWQNRKVETTPTRNSQHAPPTRQQTATQSSRKSPELQTTPTNKNPGIRLKAVLDTISNQTGFVPRKFISRSSCQDAIRRCESLDECRWHLGELRVRCATTTTSCRREECAASLQRFSTYVPFALVESIMFCHCASNDPECLAQQETVYPKCLYKTSGFLPTCTQAVSKCDSDTRCRHLLHALKAHCPVRDGECARSSLDDCRRTILAARASILEQPCICKLSDVQCLAHQNSMIPTNACIEKAMIEYSRIMGYHREGSSNSGLATNRVFVAKSMAEGGKKMIAETKIPTTPKPIRKPLQTSTTITPPITPTTSASKKSSFLDLFGIFSNKKKTEMSTSDRATLDEEETMVINKKADHIPPLSPSIAEKRPRFRTTVTPATTAEPPPPWISTTSPPPTTTTVYTTHTPPPMEGCTVKDSNGRLLFTPIGSVMRRYVDWSGRCSNWCECESENNMVCESVPCLEKGKCDAPLTTIEFGERVFLKERGACYCESSEFICEHAAEPPDMYPGLYLSIGYSNRDVDTLRKAVPRDVLDKAGFSSSDTSNDIASRMQIAFEQLLPDQIRCRIVTMGELSEPGNALYRIEWYGRNEMFNHTRVKWHSDGAEKICSPYVHKLSDHFSLNESPRFQLVLSTVKQVKVIDYLDGLPTSFSSGHSISLILTLAIIFQL